jgi:formylglycine-generating enzyme required for sulfatase activity
MDPISTIITAIIGGIAAASHDVAAQVIKDGYSGFKTLLIRKFGNTSDVKTAIEKVTEKPDSEAWKQVLKEALLELRADQDSELIQMAQTFLELLNQQSGNANNLKLYKIDTINNNYNMLVLTEDIYRKIIGQATPPEDLQEATKTYLQYIINRYRYLDFKGMGVSDKVPLRLELQDLYVPLKACVEMPKGETWSRDLHVAGRKMSKDDIENLGEHLSEPKTLLELLKKYNGLIILGDPGAGKTTFLKFLALQMAQGKCEEVRLPVLVPLSAYANAIDKKNIRLDNFIENYFHELGADLPVGSLLKKALKKGSALVMLDGLDEVKDLRLRETVVRQVVEFYNFHHSKGNKFLLTSRIIGYREVRPVAENLTECTLIDFGDPEIKEFVAQWTVAIEKAARGDTTVASQEAAKEQQELLDAVRHNDGVRRLAANPLLLTILALMKRQGVTLPERRVELYQKYVETLLSSWNRARGLGRPPVHDLDVVETVKILAPLALWMHEVNPGVGLVKHGALMEKLKNIYSERGESDPESSAQQFLSDIHDHTGILLERGQGQYGFIHLTFEEYLAAIALAQHGQQSIEPVVTALSKYAGNPAWREVSLLTIGYLGIVQQRDEAAGAVVEGLLHSKTNQSGECIVLAGDAVADVWPGGVTVSSKNAAIDTLLKTMQDDENVKPVIRARAGRALARLGDQRKGVGLKDGLPDIDWIKIEAGPFTMGSKRDDKAAYDYEKPQFICNLMKENYGISRYPVTVAQYAPFIESGGYKEDKYWTKSGRAWKEENQITGPETYRDVFQTLNHPQVGVSWYEVVAYCNWLSEKLNCQISLPTEAQWERAARYTDGRIFPWGNEGKPEELCNMSDTRIGSTSPVGIFPKGNAKSGVSGMAGNVWEWTCSLWGKDLNVPDFKYPYDSRDDRENFEAGSEYLRILRGGSFDFDSRFVRCACRVRGSPGGRYCNVGFRIVLSPFFL